MSIYNVKGKTVGSRFPFIRLLHSSTFTWDVFYQGKIEIFLEKSSLFHPLADPHHDGLHRGYGLPFRTL